MEFLEKILPLIGVVIGLWLGPLVSNRIQNKNNKKALRAELIYSLYMFFNYRKVTYGSSMRTTFNGRLSSNIWKSLRKLDIEPTERRELERQYQVLKDVADKAEDRQHQSVDKIIEFEGEILKQLSLVQRYYGTAIYKSVYRLIQPHIDESNSFRPMNFHFMPEQEFAEYNRSDYANELHKIDEDMAKKCDDLIKKVQNQMPV